MTSSTMDFCSDIVLAVVIKVTTINFGMMLGWTMAEMVFCAPFDKQLASYLATLDAAPIPTNGSHVDNNSLCHW